jgi:D-alanine-D-alanine ligase
MSRKKKPLKIMVLMHEDLVPPDSLRGVDKAEKALIKTEFDVSSTLKKLGHEVRNLGVLEEILPIRTLIKEWAPDIVFNLLESFNGDSLYDQHVVAYLELMRQAYTGCNPRGLTIARDKALSKKILSYHRIRVPKFCVFVRGKKIKKPKHLEYPLIVKSLIEEASIGIAQASVVRDHDKLVDRVKFIHEKIKTDAIVEQYIEGRELYVGVMGNERLRVFPAWEIFFDHMPEDSVKIATSKVKWDEAYQKKHKIKWKKSDASDDFQKRLSKICRRAFRILNLNGYARFDFRVTSDEKIYLLEANPNPNIANGDEFAESAKAVGITYENLLERLLRLGLKHSS